MVERLVNTFLNAQRITNVETCFGSSGQSLGATGRVLVGEGVLTKMCRKKPKPRQFFLFNDILVYGNIIINKKKYNKQHIIPLEEVKLENLSDDDVMKNGWLVRTPTKSFAVYAATATEKSEWMAHINKCLEELLNKTGKKPSTEHAAVWVPDAEANICMHCRKVQFSFINRRHHCRKCGTVVCGMCSNKKFLLPSQSSKPLRVCLSCHDTLSKMRVDFPPEPQKIVKHPSSPTSPDSSGDDDSDYEDEENIENGRPRTALTSDEVNKNLEQLYIEEKPTFYGDHDENQKEDISDKLGSRIENTVHVPSVTVPQNCSVSKTETKMKCSTVDTYSSQTSNPNHGGNTTDHGSNTTHHGNNAIEHGSNTTHHSSNSTEHGSNATHHSSNTTEHRSTATHHSSSTTHHGSSTTDHGSSTTDHGSSTAD